MAKAQWIANCGHWDSKVCTNRRNAQFAEENGKDRPCSVCAKVQWVEEQKAKTQTNIETLNATETLPDLQGSEKQIAWAEGLRANFILGMEKYFAEKVIPKMKSAEEAELEEKEIERIRGQYACIQQALVELKSETSAKEWIDSRFLSAGQLLEYKALEISKR